MLDMPTVTNLPSGETNDERQLSEANVRIVLTVQPTFGQRTEGKATLSFVFKGKNLEFVFGIKLTQLLVRHRESASREIWCPQTAIRRRPFLSDWVRNSSKLTGMSSQQQRLE